MRNPAFSISLMTAPAFPALTVSGFKIVNVFCINIGCDETQRHRDHREKPHQRVFTRLFSVVSVPLCFTVSGSPAWLPSFHWLFPYRLRRWRRHGPYGGPEARSDRR